MYAVEEYTWEQLIPEAAPGLGGYIVQVQIGAIALVEIVPAHCYPVAAMPAALIDAD